MHLKHVVALTNLIVFPRILVVPCSTLPTSPTT